MHDLTIGCDLDDTIIDHTPHRRALNKEFALKLSDRALREPKKYILDKDILQQYIDELYGARSESAPPFEKSLKTLNKLSGQHTIYIISKRLVPSPAQKWVERHLPQISKDKIFFTHSDQEKVDKIISLDLNIHIDDKLSILTEVPDKIEKILFDPFGFHKNESFIRASSWTDVSDLIMRRAAQF